MTNEGLEPYPEYDPYPDGVCYCAGCIGMGPCDDELGKTDDDDDDLPCEPGCDCGYCGPPRGEPRIITIRAEGGL